MTLMAPLLKARPCSNDADGAVVSSSWAGAAKAAVPHTLLQKNRRNSNMLNLQERNVFKASLPKYRIFFFIRAGAVNITNYTKINQCF